MRNAELGEKVVDQAAAAGKKTAGQAKSVGKKAAEGLNKMRNIRNRFEIQKRRSCRSLEMLLDRARQ